MKNSLLWFALLLMGVVVQSCVEEDETILAEKVQFTCTMSFDEAGRAQGTTTPTSILLSLETSLGVPVYSLKEVKLLNLGNAFITEPLELLQGGYKVTDFLLVSEPSQVLYAVPRIGSPLSKAVNKPLPFNFWVTKNKISNIEIEVLDVSTKTPEDFGYSSFTINSVNPLRISVFVTDGGNNQLTSANAYIISGNDTIKNYSLGATINLISFKGDPESFYKLIITKDGYNNYIKDFTYNELIKELNNLPLKVYLIKSTFTMLAFVDENNNNTFEFSLGSSGIHKIDWGDGSISTNATIHTYASSGNYLIKVTGELEKIQSLYSFYGQGMMDEINVQGLTDLQSIRIGLTRGPKKIDLRNNGKLKSVFIPNIEQLETLTLPISGTIRTINISGPNKLSATAVDEIINSVYESATLHNEIGGTFVLSKTWYPETDLMIGPPSPTSLTKLRELRDKYQWTITPDPL